MFPRSYRINYRQDKGILDRTPGSVEQILLVLGGESGVGKEPGNKLISFLDGMR
jgi:hypothetical protein